MEHKSTFEIEIITTHGVVVWTPISVHSSTRLDSGTLIHDKKDFVYNNAVQTEFEAFGKAILTGSIDPRQDPSEAFKDLALLQALLKSAEDNSLVKVITVQDLS
jgi:predicted dehydrogenase